MECTESSLATVTIGHCARAFRRIVADIFEVPGGKKRFDYRNGGNKQWLEKVGSIPLAEVTPERVADWKRKFISGRRQ